MSDRLRGWRAVLATLALLLCLPAPLASAPATGPRTALRTLEHTLVGSGSANWSGYSLDGVEATAIAGTWTVQPARCAAGETSWSSPWVGIDGDNSATVEQIGTDTDCDRGAPIYFPWYEIYPRGTVPIPYEVVPGDSMTGSVHYVGSGTFILTLTDHTAGWTYTTRQTATMARRTSVEWIVEGPDRPRLTNFGTLRFTADSATIVGEKATLWSFGPTAQAIMMTTARGVVRAAPGRVGPGGFADTWRHH